MRHEKKIPKNNRINLISHGIGWNFFAATYNLWHIKYGERTA